MLLTVHAKPRAKRNAISAWLDATTVKVEVTAAPEDGKANEAIVELLAEELGVSKSSVRIVRGFTTRMKHVEIDGWKPKSRA